MDNFNINIRNINTSSSHIFFQDYILNKNFLKNEDEIFVNDGELKLTIHTDEFKLDSFCINFKIIGTLKLICDISLKRFIYPIDILEKVRFKFGEKHEEIDLNYYIIKNDTTYLNLKTHIKDFINLSVPIKKLHPEFHNNDTFKYICKNN